MYTGEWESNRLIAYVNYPFDFSEWFSIVNVALDRVTSYSHCAMHDSSTHTGDIHTSISSELFPLDYKSKPRGSGNCPVKASLRLCPLALKAVDSFGSAGYQDPRKQLE